jgi:hypothetical protein
MYRYPAVASKPGIVNQLVEAYIHLSVSLHSSVWSAAESRKLHRRHFIYGF